MTGRQKIFSHEYTVDFNCLQAMLRAGYSKKYAKHWNTKILEDIGVKTEIDRIIAKRVKKCDFTADEIREQMEWGAKEARKRGDLQALARFTELQGRHKAMFTDKHQDVTPEPLDQERKEELAEEAEQLGKAQVLKLAQKAG